MPFGIFKGSLLESFLFIYECVYIHVTHGILCNFVQFKNNINSSNLTITYF